MTITITPEMSRQIEAKLASGTYESREEVLRAALEALDEQEETCAAIAEGYEDALAGRTRSWAEADAEFRRLKGI
ncbi:MAG: type II toxin-antitoxin system ParD family antitoxin [Pirellulales bacterium]